MSVGRWVRAEHTHQHRRVARELIVEAPCSSMMMPVKETCPQRSASSHRRSHRRRMPLPVKRATAPPIEHRPQQRERGALQHCSWERASNEGLSELCCCWAATFSREQRRDRLQLSARSEAHAPSPFARMPVLMVDPTSKPMTAVPGKLFPQGGELGIIPHLQPARCTRSTYARMAG